MFIKKLKYIYLILLLVSLAITQGGCANRNARSSSHYVKVPHYYPATRYAVCGSVARQWAAKMPSSKSSGWLFSEDFGRILVMDVFAWTAGYAYSLVVELPVSLVADTVLLPKDIQRVRDYKSGEDFFFASLLGDNWPISVESLRTHYHWKNCDPLIQRFLEKQDAIHRKEKILSLIAAGAGLEYIAAIDDLDADMAQNIMTQVEVEHPMRFGTLNTLARNPLIPEEIMIQIMLADPYDRWSPSPLESLIDNPSVTPKVLNALADNIEKPSLLVRVARHKSTAPETLDRIAQRNIVSVNRVIAVNPSIRPETLKRIAERSSNDPELAALLATNPKTPSEMLHRIVEDVSDPLQGKWILRDVGLHPAANDETLRLILKTCDKLDRHPAARDAKEVIDEARGIASKRLSRE